MFDLLDGQSEMINDLAARTDYAHIERCRLVDWNSRGSHLLEISDNPEAFRSVLLFCDKTENRVFELVAEPSEVLPRLRSNSWSASGDTGPYITRGTGFLDLLSVAFSFHALHPFEVLPALFYLHFLGTLVVVFIEDVLSDVHPIADDLLRYVLGEVVSYRPSPDGVWAYT